MVRHRKAVLAAAVLLLIPSVFGAAGTYINYDILTYLPPELDSMVGEGYLEDDFNMASTSMITVENMSTADTLALKSELEAVAGVKSVLWTSDILDVTTPKEMLPADIQKFFYSENGATLLLVQFENPSAHAVTMQAQRTIKDILRKDCFIGGMSAILEDTKSLVNQEMPVYIPVSYTHLDVYKRQGHRLLGGGPSRQPDRAPQNHPAGKHPHPRQPVGRSIGQAHLIL